MLIHAILGNCISIGYEYTKWKKCINRNSLVVIIVVIIIIIIIIIIITIIEFRTCLSVCIATHTSFQRPLDT